MWRLTRGSIGPTAALLVAIVLIVVVLVSDVDRATRSSVTIVGVLVMLLAGPKLVTTIRAWRHVLTRPWRYFDGHTYVSKMAARIDVRDPDPDPEAGPDPDPDRHADGDAEVMYFAASANRRQRKALRTGMFTHLWFVGDLDAGRGIVAPAGGGPMISVRRLAAIERLAAPSGSTKADRPGLAAAARKKDRDAKQRAAAAASGQALPAQLQRRGRRQNVSGLLPMSGDESE
jgi:hypothetical protein